VRLIHVTAAACFGALAMAAMAEAQPGHCPPGQAKKGNCEPGMTRVPPGQAKKWAQGQALPPHVVYHAYPRQRWGSLAPPPPGYDYVQVDDDVLLMEQATRVIVNFVLNLR